MSGILIWAGLHKVPIFVSIAITMWAAGFLIYFRPEIRRSRFRGRRHSWSVDLVQKQTYRNNQLEKRKP